MKRLFRYSPFAVLAVALTCHQAFASVNFAIGPFSSGGFSATSIHSVGSGSSDKMSGPVSSGLSGNLLGDFTNFLSGNVLAITGGGISGFVGGALGADNGDPLSVEFTGGKLKFFANSDRTVGGWIDYNLKRAGNLVDTATFFFSDNNFGFNLNQPGPNRWIGTEANSDLQFTLWGNNWVTSSHDWGFLTNAEGLGFSDNLALLTRDAQTNNNSGFLPLGTDIHGEITPSPGQQGHTPEPLSLIVWGALIAVCGLRRFPRS